MSISCKDCIRCERNVTSRDDRTHLRESAVVPDISVVGEAVPHETQFSALDVLLDRVESLLLRDFHLRVGPAGDFNDHVEDAVVLIGEKGDIVPWRHNLSVFLGVYAVVYDTCYTSAPSR